MEGITPPSHLDLRADDLSGAWRRWVRSFNDYLLAIDLVATTKAAEKQKLALFRHVGGEDVRELYSQMEFLADTDGSRSEIEEGNTGSVINTCAKDTTTLCNRQEKTELYCILQNKGA